jgi:hypothetical protein
MESQPIDLKNESNRLATFTGWPLSFIISPKSLAAAGFYYTKHTDKVIIYLYIFFSLISSNVR